MNAGDKNTGDMNTGNKNTGNYNTGNYNAGDYNAGNFNTGAFNRDCPKMRLFEKELDMTVEEFYEQYDIGADIAISEWVYESDMTDDEKAINPEYETTGGYLREYDLKDACRKWWSENPEDHERFLTLPGFDWEIFTDITGITPDMDEEEIEIDGKKYSKSTIKNALREYVK